MVIVMLRKEREEFYAGSLLEVVEWECNTADGWIPSKYATMCSKGDKMMQFKEL